MPRSKKDVAENIRSSVVSAGRSTKKQVSDIQSNIEVAKTVQSVAIQIKTLSEQEKEFFEKLLKGVAEIPRSNEEFQRYQQRLYQDLIKTTAIIKEAAEKETDVKKKEELVKAAQQMEQKGKQLEVEIDKSPRSFKESMAQRHFGLEPQRVRKEGFFKTLKSTIKEGIIPQNEERFSSAVDLERQASQIKPEKFTPESKLKQKTQKNSEGLVAQTLQKILTEVTVLRQVVEGRIKYDPNMKGNKYYELGEKGKKRSVSSEKIREAERGLYTQKELKEIQKKESSVSTKVSKKSKKATGIVSEDEQNENVDRDSVVASVKKKGRKGKSLETQDTEDEQNENVERDIAAATIKKDEARFLSAGTDTETDIKPEEKQKEQPSSGGGVGSILGGLGSLILGGGLKGAKNVLGKGLKFGKGLITKSAGKTVAQAGIKKAGKSVATKTGTKIAAKIGAKTLGKSVLKKIPLIGLAAGIGFGINRALKGDFTGALGEVASGAASTIPGIGTAASVAIDAGLAAKDIKQEMSQQQGDESSTVQATTEPTQPSTAPIESQLQQQATGAVTTTAKLEATQQRIASQKIQQGTMPDQTQQPPVVNNITNNNYQGGKGKSDSSIEKFMPPVRPTDTTFLRYQDKRMTRVL
jgi:hypothetical protein